MAMTVRQVYEAHLIEMNKTQAPSLLLEDFNYFFNKAINQYVNKKYNLYDVNQQSTDDMRVLKASSILKVKKTSLYGESTGVTGRIGAIYEAYLPIDYLHLLNCICNFKVKKQFKCYDPNTYVQFGATRLTADLQGQIMNNFYMRPSYKRPYYYLHNVNPVDSNTGVSSTTLPTNPYSPNNPQGTDMGINPYGVTTSTNNVTIYNPVNGNESFDESQTYYTLKADGSGYTPVETASEEAFSEREVTWYTKQQAGDINQGGITNLPRTFTFTDGSSGSLIEKPTAQRLANPSQVRIEIRCGRDDSVFELDSIQVDYIKAPQYIRLTQEQIDLTEDTSQMMEFPDYVCQEIINELTHIVMENASDPRLQSHIPISTSIANPAQQQSTSE